MFHEIGHIDNGDSTSEIVSLETYLDTIAKGCYDNKDRCSR